MSLLSIIQDHCRLHGLAVPSSVIGNSDVTVSQLLSAANAVLDEIVDANGLEAFVYEATFSFIAAEDQGAVENLAGGLSGFQFIKNGTFYDRTLRRPVYGPMTEIEWQQIKAIPNPGPFYKYRIRSGNLLINPVPAVPLSTVAFEYVSSFGVRSSTGTAKQYFTEDSDTFILPERILKSGLSYRWKQIKGLPYQSDEKRFWDQLNNAIARSGTKPDLNLSHSHLPDIKPGIFVPSGNWNV